MSSSEDRVRSKKPNRREQLTTAAFRAIAEKGFEGLRIREVAAQVGINGASLHHYFPTKEDLIRSVVAYTTDRVRLTIMRNASTATPPEQLRDHLTRVYRLMQEEPDLYIVLIEVSLRARRTPVLQFLVDQNRIWHQIIRDMLEQGVKQGFWATDLDTAATADTIITTMQGLSLWAAIVPDRGEKVLSKLEQWLNLA